MKFVGIREIIQIINTIRIAKRKGKTEKVLKIVSNRVDHLRKNDLKKKE